MTNLISKKQLTERVTKRTKYPKNQVENIITELLAETKKSLLKNEEVRFLGYYSLKTITQRTRMAMNLQTGKNESAN